MLRTRSGDFIRGIILENAGVDGEAESIDRWQNALCNRDSCTISIESAGRNWTILATRSSYYMSALALSAACRRADVVISERRLPSSCQPRWIKADKSTLKRTGGMTIDLEQQRVSTVRQWSGEHEWTGYNNQKVSNQKSGHVVKPQL